MARVEGDGELLRKMIPLFFAQAEKLLPEIRGAGERQDGRRLERAAHKLKGSMCSFAAAPAVGAAFRLERMGRDGDFVGVELANADLEREVERLRKALSKFLEESLPCVS